MLIADSAPIVEAIATRCVADLMSQGISVGKAGLLPFVYANRLSLPGGFALTLPNGYQRSVSVRIDIETILTGLSDGESLVGRVDLVDLAAVELADMHIQSALMQLDLRGVIRDVGQGQTGFRADSHHTSAQIQLGAGVFVGPNVVRVGERAVQRALHPLARSLRLHGN